MCSARNMEVAITQTAERILPALFVGIATGKPQEGKVDAWRLPRHHFISLQQRYEAVERRGYCCSRRHRDDPGYHDVAGQSPAHGGDTTSRAHSNDCSGDGMRRRNGNTEPRRSEECQGSAGLCAETLHGVEPGDLRPHGMNDPPSAKERTESHCRLAGNDHPEKARRMSGRDIPG